MDYTGIDTKIYGAEDVPLRGAANAISNYTAPDPVRGVLAVTKGARSLIDEGAAKLVQDNRPEATIPESVGAGMSQWLPVHVYDFLTAPTFPTAVDFKPSSMLAQVPFQMDKTQEKFMLETRSPEEFQYRLEHMEQQNLAYQAMGDHAIASFVTGAIDPGYLAIDVVSLGAARLARLGGAGAKVSKLAAGAAAFAGTYAMGKIEQAVVPLSEQEVFLNAMANGAATAIFHNGKALVPKDEHFPANELTASTQAMKQATEAGAERAAIKVEEALVDLRPHPDPSVEVPVRLSRQVVSDAPFVSRSGRGVLRALEKDADPMVAVLAKRVGELMVDDIEVRQVAKKHLMGGGRAYYEPGAHAVFIAKDTPAHVQLHEMTHAITAHKIEYGLANPNSAHGKIVQELQSVFEQAKKAVGSEAHAHPDTGYFFKDLHEFVAGVFSGKSEFVDKLASVKVADTGRSVLGSVVDAVRRILGMAPGDTNALTHTLGLTEALAKERLNVDLVRGQKVRLPDGSEILGHGMGVRLAPPGPDSIAAKVGKGISWSLHKTLESFGPATKKVADLLVDNPLDMSGNSVVSQHRAIRAELQTTQFLYEDALSASLAERGFGVLNRILKPRQALAAQQALERDVGLEMLRRNRAAMEGRTISKVGVPEDITKMADALDDISKQALEELKASGVFGADDIAEMSGYFSRRWDFGKIDTIEAKFTAAGRSAQQARETIQDAISIGMQRANGWDAELAGDVARAVYDRARSKGYFEDAALRRHVGEDTLAEVRGILSGTGISPARQQRVLDVLAGKADEAGKAAQLKHRVDIAMDETLYMPDGSTHTLADMIDMNMASTTERYLDMVASQSAFARKGLTKSSDIVALRKELLEGIPDVTTRGQAADLFDNTVAYLRGDPVGEKLPDFMRKAAALTQMVGLARAGLFQFTEYATSMAHYGMLNTVGSMFKELPFVRGMLSDPGEAGHLRNVLERNASQDMRIRPFINRMEDNFEIPISDAVQLSLMQAKQLVPYMNALKWIQNHQARTVGNLIVNTFERAAGGNAAALKALEHYGLESHTIGQIRADIATHGMDTAKWSKATFDEVRGPLNKMMDDAVLRNRTGEIPAFAQFSSTGKFLFTFRSFVLGAHNKVLAGSLNRGGFGGLGLLMLYQFPLTYAITAANNATTQNKKRTTSQLVGDSMAQMGALGLITEPIGVVLGTKQQFGSPGTIAIDRVYKLGGALASGKNVASNAVNSTPLLSAILPMKAIGENLKDHKE